MERHYTKKETADILGISMNTLTRLMGNQSIQFYKLGQSKTHKVYFLKSDIEEFQNKKASSVFAVYGIKKTLKFIEILKNIYACDTLEEAEKVLGIKRNVENIKKLLED